MAAAAASESVTPTGCTSGTVTVTSADDTVASRASDAPSDSAVDRSFADFDDADVVDVSVTKSDAQPEPQPARSDKKRTREGDGNADTEDEEEGDEDEPISLLTDDDDDEDTFASARAELAASRSGHTCTGKSNPAQSTSTPVLVSNSPPKKKKKHTKKLKPSTSLAPRSIEPRPEQREEIAALKRMLDEERVNRTGWIPSLTTRIAANDIDHHETMEAARAQIAGGGASDIAERRMAQDTFLLNLAMKHAKPAKKRSPRKKANISHESNQTDVTTLSETPVPAADGASAVSVTPATKPKAARKPAKPKPKKDFVPSDMEFLMLQEKLGWAKK